MSSTAVDITTLSLRELTDHIVSTHHEYLKLHLPRLRKKIEEVKVAHAGRPHPKLDRIEAVFQVLYDDLAMHLHKEEVVLFPAIDAMERAAQNGFAPQFPFGSIGNPIAMMEREHVGAGDALAEIVHHLGLADVEELALRKRLSVRVLFEHGQALQDTHGGCNLPRIAPVIIDRRARAGTARA